MTKNGKKGRKEQRDLDGKTVGATVRSERSESVRLRFKAQHFELRIGEDMLDKLMKKGASKARDKLVKKVAPLRDVDAIPEGARDIETAALVAKAMTSGGA